MRHRGHGKGFCKALVALRTNDVLATGPRLFHVAMEALLRDLLVSGSALGSDHCGDSSLVHGRSEARPQRSATPPPTISLSV